MENLHLEPLGNGIEIYVTKSYRYSTDTILLADFSKPQGGKKCVELGTGCGTIPLLWCRDNRNLKIDAVEIQENACLLAEKSVRHNRLEDCINVVNADLCSLKGRLEFGCYDVAVCNPPYKIGGGGVKNPSSARLIARHESECTLDDICAAAAKLLQFGGRFFMCQRPERLSDVMESMRKFDIEPKTLRLVQQRVSKAPKLFLLEGRRGGKRGFLNVLPTLFVEDESGSFSQEMLEIYGCYKKDYIENAEESKV